MSAFRVWVRSLGSAMRVRVEGLGNAEWLLGQLSQSFIFKSSAPMLEEPEVGHYSFHIMYGPHVSRRSLERQLTAIPGLTLMLEPA